MSTLEQPAVAPVGLPFVPNTRLSVWRMSKVGFVVRAELLICVVKFVAIHTKRGLGAESAGVCLGRRQNGAYMADILVQATTSGLVWCVLVPKRRQLNSLRLCPE